MCNIIILIKRQYNWTSATGKAAKDSVPGTSNWFLVTTCQPFNFLSFDLSVCGL